MENIVKKDGGNKYKPESFATLSNTQSQLCD